MSFGENGPSRCIFSQMKNPMTKIRVCALLLFFLSFVSPAVAATASFAPYTVPGTELRPFHSNETNRDYLLYISYPESYEKSPGRVYPVVYMTDAYWNFGMMQSLRRGLGNDGNAPEFLIVGVGYADTSLDYICERTFELTPDSGHGIITDKDGVRHGGSQKFLRAFKNEIIPYVEANLRADKSFRVLAGHSLGGSFCLLAMYEEPGLFQGLIATSPAVICEDRWMFAREKELRARALGPDGKGALSLHTRLFMSGADREWPDLLADVVAFDKVVRNGGYKDLQYQFRMIDGDGHDGNTAEAYNHGLRFVFSGMKSSGK